MSDHEECENCSRRYHWNDDNLFYNVVDSRNGPMRVCSDCYSSFDWEED